MRFDAQGISQGYWRAFVPHLLPRFAVSQVERKISTVTTKAVVAMLKFTVTVLAFRQHKVKTSLQQVRVTVRAPLSRAAVLYQ